MAIRIAHFSDIHLTAPNSRLQARDWVSKRAIGWMNVRFGRGKHFRHATQITAALANELRARGCDQIVFSGDATVLGLPTEFELVKETLRLDEAVPRAMAVPGNHDYYVRQSVKRHLFEAVFSDWQHGERVEKSTYPFVQRLGGLWLIAVNSACPNLAFWDARGRVGKPQRLRLKSLCENLPPGPRVVVTHYPLRLVDGRPETRWRRMRDDVQMLDLARQLNIKLWLHGHRHGFYHFGPNAELPFHQFCAGSTTQEEKWGYNEYTFADGTMRCHRRDWSVDDAQFVDGETVTIDFAIPAE